MGATADVARYVAEGRLEDVPEGVREFAKLLFLDTLGVAVAGTLLPAARIATGYAERLGATGGDAHVLGASHRWAPAVAAFANGVSAHTLDYDDTSFLTVAHSSGSAVPALLAVAEETGASGRDVLEAFVYAHEGLARLALAVMPTHYLLGWHTTGTLSTLSAALAAAKVMGFDAERTAQTLGIAASMAGGMRANFGTFTKALHTGMAAFHGVLSAGLARDSFTGNPDILEHRYGFWPLMAGAENVRPELTTAAVRDTSRFYLEDPGVGIKLHPCNSAVLAGIGAALRLTIEHDVQPEAVERVDYGYMHVARGIVPFDEPRNSPEAQYSMTHAIAAAVVRPPPGGAAV
ncbi:MAG: MmgE/PrpD family protein [Chloroflexota bacterium]|nr:MmgE/PrpD family protein [Chloroflexota bacterium]